MNKNAGSVLSSAVLVVVDVFGLGWVWGRFVLQNVVFGPLWGNI